MLKPNDQWDGFGVGVFRKWLVYEDGVIINGIIAFIKEALESSRASYAMWKYSEKTLFMNQEVVSH